MDKKPWLKATKDGALYVDTTHPEWIKWFKQEVERLSNSELTKRIRRNV